MKNVFLFAILLAFLASCQSGGAGKVQVSGTVKGFGSGEIYFIEPSDNPTVDTIQVKDDQFSKEFTVKEPTVYMISFGQDQQPGFVVLEAGKAEISYTKDEVGSLKATCGEEQKVLESFNTMAKPYYKQMDSLGMLAMAGGDQVDTAQLFALQAEFEKLNEGLNQKQMEFIKANPKGIATAFIALSFLAEKQNPDVAEVNAIYNGLDKKAKASFFGIKIKEIAEKLSKTKPGTTAPGFTLPDVNGDMVSLSQYKGQYVLVDFWASWCKPCREENPNVVAAYQKFHAKGFDILGVSLDEDKAKWKEAIQADGLTWKHVSDLKGWKSDIAALYNIQSIPSNVLLDKEGKIIATNLRGADLMKQLSTLMP
ncbi:MAG: redoxin domain-containing protein [Chitinophagaceae bacterium]